ncbi:MAG: hypothetical protein ACRD0P_19545 [Stackebrandtia sp.]
MTRTFCGPDTGAIWFGNPGSLVRLPDPSPDVETVRTREVAVHVGVSGGRTVDVSGSGLRTFTYAFSRLTQAEFDVIDAFHAGVHGPGPFALVDPVHSNRLTTNQSSGGTVYGDTSGFATAAPGAVMVDTCTSHATGSSILWSLPARELWNLELPSGWACLPDGTRAFPVIPGVRVNLAGWVMPYQSTWIGWQPSFYDATGAPISQYPCGTDAYTAHAWQHMSGYAVAPPAAAWIAPRITAVSLTAGTGVEPAGLHIDELSMTYGNHPHGPDARPGSGIPQVAISEWTQTIPHIGHMDAKLALTEVSADWARQEASP